MKDYLKLIFVFLLFFASIFLTMSGEVPPIFNYVLFAVVLYFGIFAIQRHESKYIKTMLTIGITVQLVFSLAFPYWILHQDMGLNVAWPYFPELLWTAGTMVAWYLLISFVFIPIIVFLYGRRAWCSFICGTGVMAETLGDEYRKKGAKSNGIPAFFTALRWIILIASVALTVAFLAGDPQNKLLNMIYLIVFIFVLRLFFMQAVNIILMPKFGTRIWCKYFCPQGLLIGLFSRFGRFALVKNESLCVNCGTCNQNCSMSIDIANGPTINKSDDCVGCGVCVEVCPNNALSMVTDRQAYQEKSNLSKTV